MQIPGLLVEYLGIDYGNYPESMPLGGGWLLAEVGLVDVMEIQTRVPGPMLPAYLNRLNELLQYQACDFLLHRKKWFLGHGSKVGSVAFPYCSD